MKYKQKSFLVPYLSKEYRNNWEKVFGGDVRKVKLQVGDLVGVKEFGGCWTLTTPGTWIKDAAPSYWYWFGVVGEIKKPGDVPHTGRPEDCIKIRYYDSDSGKKMWSWHNREELYFVKRNVQKMWEKRR
jgi:hypothetical protein